jgi:hypothetical protein
MGGVSARLADGAGFACAMTSAAKSARENSTAIKRRIIFMQTFYQKRPEIGIEDRQTENSSRAEAYTMPGW